MCYRWCRQFLFHSRSLCLSLSLSQYFYWDSLRPTHFSFARFLLLFGITFSTLLRLLLLPKLRTRRSEEIRHRWRAAQKSKCTDTIQLLFDSCFFSIWNDSSRCVSQRSVSNIWQCVKCKQTDVELVSKSEVTLNRCSSLSWFVAVLNMINNVILTLSKVRFFFPRVFISKKDWRCSLFQQVRTYQAEEMERRRAESGRNKCDESMHRRVAAVLSRTLFSSCSRRSSVFFSSSSSFQIRKSLTGDSAIRVSNIWSVCCRKREKERQRKKRKEKNKKERSTSIDVLQIHSDSIRLSNYEPLHPARS